MIEDVQRTALIHAMFNQSGRGLEVGASYNPIVSKRAGFNVEVVDHASTEDLKAKYVNNLAVDASRIEEVDYVWDGRPLSEVIGEHARYDYIVASHVIEHVPDMLGFLKECDLLLKPTGVLFLAVPDKRRCFDVFRPLSSTGAVLQAHLERRRVHSAASAFDHVANMAMLEVADGWSAGANGTFNLHHPLHFAKSVFDRASESETYYDFHAWIFTPSSFRLILRDLNELDVLKLKEMEFRPTEGIEFFMTLSRSSNGCAINRISMLQNIQEEITEFPSKIGLSPKLVTMREKISKVLKLRGSFSRFTLLNPK